MKKGSWLWDLVHPCVGFDCVMAASVADMIYSCLYAKRGTVKRLKLSRLHGKESQNKDAANNLTNLS